MCFCLKYSPCRKKEFDKEYVEAQWEYENDKFIILHRICVKVKYQNNGIGTKMMEMIEDKKNDKTAHNRHVYASPLSPSPTFL
ncbi:MAG: GNAT family N-acetyltransferase [Treponema sp.]|nr:GNAT family N-acetyltransferase [Treponema sp.]